MADVRSTVGSTLVTGSSGPAQQHAFAFVRKEAPFISSVDFNYNSGGGFSESADIRMSGMAFNGLWRYGGKILDDPLGNANFSLLYSFGSIFDAVWLRNVMFELERKVEPLSLGQSNDLKRTNSARLFYRISF